MRNDGALVQIRPRGSKLIGRGCREAFGYAGPDTVQITAHDPGSITIEVPQENQNLVRRVEVR